MRFYILYGIFLLGIGFSGFFNGEILAQSAYYYARKGFEQALEGEYRKALDFYDRALRANPRNAEFHFYRGICLFELDGFKEGIDAFTHALIIRGDAKYYFYRAKCYYYLEDYFEAIYDLNDAIEINPDDPEFYYYRGMCTSQMEMHDEAILDFTVAIKIEPRIGEYYVNRGLCEIVMGQKEEACKDFAKGVELKAFNAKHYFQKYCYGTQ